MKIICRNSVYNILLVFSCLCITGVNTTKAQCTVHGNGSKQFASVDVTPGITKGQTFTACQTGLVKSVEINFARVEANTTIEFRISQSPLIPTTILGDTDVQIVNIANSGPQILSVDLATPLAVTIGNTYAFDLRTINGSYSCFTSEAYSEGTAYAFLRGRFLVSSSDFDFGIDIAPESTIPTLSQWALFILGLSLTSLAVVRIRKMALA